MNKVRSFLKVAGIILVTLTIAHAETLGKKKYEYPLELPELFESRLAELGVSKIGIDYLQAIDRCTHWGGEEAYDKARAKQIREGSERDCGRAEKMAKVFKNSKPSEKSKKIVSKVAGDLRGEDEHGAYAEINVDVFDISYFIWKDPQQKSLVMQSYFDSRKGR